MSVHLQLVEDYEALSHAGAEVVAGLIARKPDAALVLATGDSPMRMYQLLAERVQRGELDVSRLRLFQLDEYWGLRPDDDRSLYGWMRRAILDPWGIADSQLVRLRGDAPSPEAACRAYDEAVAAAGGFDLAVLGLGPNGHLGYNEPPAHPDSPTRLVTLTESSLETGARYWGSRDRVPRQALTAGLASLLAARQIVLLVSGAHKRKILDATLNGPITPDVPASLLRLAQNVTVIADRAAAG